MWWRRYFWYFNMKRWAPIVVLIIFWLAFFWRQIVAGQVWYCCDNLLINIPSKVFLAEELKQGRFPVWNPYIFSGTPFFADINLSVLHPFNLLYLVLPPFRALAVGILVLFLIGSVGMYFLGRTFRLGTFASLVGAVVFGFSGSLVVYANNIPILQVAVLVPWVLAFWVRYLERPANRTMATFVLIAGFQIISGHPQLTFYTWLMLIGYTILQKPSLQLVVKAAFFVILVSGVQVIPFLDFLLHSTRAGGDVAAHAADSVHPLSLVRLVIPGIVGNLSRGTAWIQAGSIHGYVGLLPLLFLPFAWISRVGKFFLVVAVASLFLAMGKYAIMGFREPVQFLFFWSFGLAGTMMVAAETLVRKPARARYIFVISLIFMFVAGILHTQDRGLWEWVSSFTFLPVRLVAKLAALPGSERQIITEGLLYNVSLFGILGLLATVAIVRLRSSMVAKAIVLGVLFTDLYVYGQTNVTTIQETIVRRWQEEAGVRIASWNLSGFDHYRYYTDRAVYPYPYKKPFGQFNDPGESAWQFKILRPTIGMLYGLPAVDGYASMVLRSYQQRFGASARDPTGITISSIVDPQLALAGVRYLITKPNNSLLADATRYRLLVVDGEIAIYEDSKAVAY